MEDVIGVDHILTASLVAVIVVLLAVVYRKSASGKYPPGPRGRPFFGNLNLLSGPAPYVTLTELRKEYGDVYSLKLGARNVVVANGWEALKEGLVTRSKDYADRPDYLSFHLMYECRENGFACNNYDKRFKLKRQFMLSYLIKNGAGSHVTEERVNDTIIEMCDDLIASQQPINPIDIVEYCTLNVIFCLMFNSRFESRNDECFKAIRKAYDVRFAAVGAMTADFLPWTRLFTRSEQDVVISTRDYLVSYMGRKIQEHHNNSDGYNVDDLLDSLIDKFKTKGDTDNNLLTDKELVYLTMDIVGGGYRTVRSTILWALAYLVKHPKTQERARKEILSVIGRERRPAMSDLSLMPYTDAVMHETHRLVSLVPFMIPHATAKDTELQGFHIPKGTDVLFNAWGMHHDEHNFEDPMNFRPERYLDDSGALKKPSNYIPFGAGRRTCPGETLAHMEFFFFLTNILQRAVIKEPDGEPIELVPIKGINIEPKQYEVCFVPLGKVYEE